MKNRILTFACAALLSSCASYKPVTSFEQPIIVLSDSNFCVSGKLSAEINHDSLFYYLDKGVVLGDKVNNVKIYYQSVGSDPLNGQIVIEPNLCVNQSDYCLTGQYFIQLHQNNFYTSIQKGLTFGTPATSIFIQYVNGKLTVTPKVCIKTKVTTKSLK